MNTDAVRIFRCLLAICIFSLRKVYLSPLFILNWVCYFCLFSNSDFKCPSFPSCFSRKRLLYLWQVIVLPLMAQPDVHHKPLHLPRRPITRCTCEQHPQRTVQGTAGIAGCGGPAFTTHGLNFQFMAPFQLGLPTTRHHWMSTNVSSPLFRLLSMCISLTPFIHLFLQR